MISVLLPSRGRPASLQASVRSLLSRAERPQDTEILVAADPDDAATAAVRLRPQDQMWTAPQRYGYLRLHEYVNHLATLASGEWLMIWNDDAVMLTAGWDVTVHAQEPGVLWPSANHHHGCNLFPIWPKAWADAAGHVSLCWNCDSWVQQVGELLGRQWRIPVEVLHDRADITGGHDDATATEGSQQAVRPGADVFWQYLPQRIADAGLIREMA